MEIELYSEEVQTENSPAIKNATEDEIPLENRTYSENRSKTGEWYIYDVESKYTVWKLRGSTLSFKVPYRKMDPKQSLPVVSHSRPIKKIVMILDNEGFVTHFRFENNEPTIRDYASNEATKSKPIVECRRCGRAFDRKIKLRKHQRGHMLRRRFRYRVPKKSFYNSNNFIKRRTNNRHKRPSLTVN